MRGARGTTLLLIGLLIAITLVLHGCPSLIANRPPNAEFSASPTQGNTPLTVQFDASASSDPDKDSPDGDIVSYEWDFGDGDTATGETVTHTYEDDGMFTAKLTVTDGKGATDTASVEITVRNLGPTASFTFTPENPQAGETVTFDASDSVDPAGVSAQSIESYEWDFGDGDTGNGETVTHTFADDGKYTVTLTVTDDDGATAETSKAVMVGNPPPEASFTFSPSNPLTNETVTFDASNSGDPASVTAQNIVSYEWNFGDGNSATGETVTHSYSDDGDYEVKLTVTDDDRGTDSVSKIVSVHNRAPQASFTADPTSGTAPLTVDFDASGSSDPDGTIQSYEWDFGDGRSGTDQAIDHIFTISGALTTRLKVIDDDGNTDTTTAHITIDPLAFVANRSSDIVTVIDTRTRSAIKQIPLRDPLIGAKNFPRAVAVTPNGKTAYVVNQESNDVHVIDILTLKKIDSIPVGDRPFEISIAPNGGTAYVINGRDDDMSVIDTANNKLKGPDIPAGNGPEDLVLTSDGKTAYIANQDGNNVSIVDLKKRKLIKSISVGGAPGAIDITPDGTTVYVVNGRDNDVSIIDTETKSKIGSDIPVGDNPVDIAITSDGETAYVSNHNDNTISVINIASNTVVDNIPVGQGPWDIEITPSGETAYVGNLHSNDLTLIDIKTNSVIDSINGVRNSPFSIAFTP